MQWSTVDLSKVKLQAMPAPLVFRENIGVCWLFKSASELPESSVGFYPGSCTCFENVARHSPYQSVSGVFLVSVWSKNLRSEVGLCLFSTKSVRISASFVTMFATDAGSTTCSSAVEFLLLLSSKFIMMGGCSSMLRLYLPLSRPVWCCAWLLRCRCDAEFASSKNSHLWYGLFVFLCPLSTRFLFKTSFLVVCLCGN